MKLLICLKTWLRKQDAHKWVATLATIIQAVAVIWGIRFAAAQLEQAVEGVNREQRDATYEILKQMHESPVREAIATINGAGEMTADQYRERTRPFHILMEQMRLCLSVGKCDANIALKELCSIAIRDALMQAIKLKPVPGKPDQTDAEGLNSMYQSLLFGPTTTGRVCGFSKPSDTFGFRSK